MRGAMGGGGYLLVSNMLDTIIIWYLMPFFAFIWWLAII